MAVHARTTTFNARPDAIDRGIALVTDEIEPAVMELDGCRGMSLLVDRSSGRCIATTAWESQQAMRASEQRVASLRARGEELFGATPEVREWEIAVLHRIRATGEGAAARVIWMRVEPQRVDEHLGVVRSLVLPRVEAFDGFCGMSLLVDRSTGTAAAASTFSSRHELVASRDGAKALRTEVVRRMQAEMLDVAEFDVALAHLRVPETV